MSELTDKLTNICSYFTPSSQETCGGAGGTICSSCEALQPIVIGVPVNFTRTDAQNLLHFAFFFIFLTRAPCEPGERDVLSVRFSHLLDPVGTFVYLSILFRTRSSKTPHTILSSIPKRSHAATMLKMKIARNQFGRQFHDSLNAVFPRERERERETGRRKERKETRKNKIDKLRNK